MMCCLNIFVFVYLDEIQIFSKSLEEHQVHVWSVLQHLLENRCQVGEIQIPLSLCHFTRLHFRRGAGEDVSSKDPGSEQMAHSHVLETPATIPWVCRLLTILNAELQVSATLTHLHQDSFSLVPRSQVSLQEIKAAVHLCICPG